MKAINFGCGLSVAAGWRNYDASPTLLMQQLPVIGAVARAWLRPRFPDLAVYGDVVRGLPESSGCADFIYCSHILEHLSLEDFRAALREVVRLLKPGGVFRGVLPDLAHYARIYLDSTDPGACSEFIERSGLGVQKRPRGLPGIMRELYGNSRHLWLWDYKGLSAELDAAGFKNIRRARYGDSAYTVFQDVENSARWENALGFECTTAI